MQAELYAKQCKIFQQFKERKNNYDRLAPKKFAEPKTWDTVHMDMIVPYSKSIRQQQLNIPIIKNNVNLICMTILNPP